MSIEVGRPLGWEPRSPAQKALLDSVGIVDFALFGGAAGSLKTETLLVDAAQEYQNPKLHALIVRKTYQEMTLDIVPKSRRLYSQMGAKYNGEEHSWTWPWGATIRFGHFESMKDCGRYYGPEFSYIGFDESTFHTEEVVRWLMTTRMRSSDPSLNLRVRLTTNPGNIGAEWHKAIFMGPHCTHCKITDESRLPGKIYRNACWPSDLVPIYSADGETPMSTMFIPGRLTDHNLLAGYANRMKGHTEKMRKCLLEGCWESFEGQFFDCWNPGTNLLKWETSQNEIGLRNSLQWFHTYFASVDWGYGKSSATAHLHVKTPDGMTYTIDEVLAKHMDAPDFAQYLRDRWCGHVDENGNEREISYWFLSPDAWQSRGMRSDSGNSIAEQMQRASQIPFETASNDRKAGWMSMYTQLKSGRWKICEDKCPLLIKAIQSRVHDPDKPGDIIKIAGDPLDDIADDCRYGIHSFIQTPRKPKSVLMAEFCDATDPTAYAMQALIAKKKFAPASTILSYRGRKVGRA